MCVSLIKVVIVIVVDCSCRRRRCASIMFNFQDLFWSVQLTNRASKYWNQMQMHQLLDRIQYILLLIILLYIISRICHPSQDPLLPSQDPLLDALFVDIFGSWDYALKRGGIPSFSATSKNSWNTCIYTSHFRHRDFVEPNCQESLYSLKALKLSNMATIHWFNLIHPLILDMTVAIVQSPH